MSLVELALKKMQSAARATAEGGRAPQAPAPAAEKGAPRLADGVFGQVVQQSSHRRLESGTVAHSDKLVRIDQVALRTAGLVPPEHQARAIADQYRHVKRPLVGAAIGRGAPKIEYGQLIMMASAMPGEGKTFTSINLALSLAMEKDISVLLIDADVAKPHISRIFGVDTEPGLMDVLSNEQLNVESTILPTDVANLSLLPAGNRSDTATELLASHRMEETLHYLADSDPSRVVLIDSPPLLLTTESRAVAHWAGQVVIVVRAEMTPHQAVLDAINHIGAEKSISLILNQSKSAATAYYYGYGEAGAPAPPAG